MSDYDYDDYTAWDAAYDEAMDALAERTQEYLDAMVHPIMLQAEELACEIHETGVDQPHPWTWLRHLAWVWEEEGEDALQELLEEEFRDEAEDAARDADDGPCCNDWHCPCGNHASPPSYMRGGKRYFY